MQRPHAAGSWTADLYRAALKGLGQDPDTVFGQHKQRGQQQINVAGDYISQQAAQPSASPALLRQTQGLPFNGVGRW